MKIALAQFNPTIGDFAGNSARILNLAAQAQSRGAELAIFSELCLCGYFPLDLLERPAFIDRNLKELKALAGKLPLASIVGYAGRVTNRATSSPPKSKAPTILATNIWASPSAKTCGTTRISGPSCATSAIR